MTTRKRQRRRSPVSQIVGAGVIIAAFFLIRNAFQQSGKQEFPPNAFYEIKRGDLLISVVEEGALRAVNETVIRNNLEGVSRIIHLAPEGSHAKKGDLLVELDCSALKDKLNEQELAHQDNLFLLLQARENLKIQKSLIESRIKDAELNVEFAQSDLSKYRDGDAPQQIRIAEARTGVLEEQVRIASERYARTQELFKNGNATRSELEADSLSQKREQLGLEQAKEDLRLIQKYDQPNNVRILESNVQQAKDELERVKQRSSNEIAQAEADLKTSQKALEVMEESIQQQKKQLEYARILAPQDGLVVYSTSSPFQGRGEGGPQEGRRGMRGEGGFGGMFDSSGGFRGGGGERRGRSRSGGFSSSSGSGGGYSSSGSGGSTGSGRSGSSSSSGGQSTLFGSSGQSTASGAAGLGSSAGSGGQTASAGGGLGSSSGGGGRGSGGGGFSSGGSGGSGGASASFASYGSLRQNASITLAGSGGQSSGGVGSSSASSSSYGSSGQSSYYGTGSSQGGSRFGSQNFSGFDLGSFGFLGMSGVIEEGAQVRQRQELIRLPDVSRMLAEIKIHESRVRQVHAGMLAYVRVETLPGRRFKGTVRRVAILPDAQTSWSNPETKVYGTDILIEDELPELKPGVSARAEIIITNLPKVLSVPIQAVTIFRGDHVCFVKRGAGVAPVTVTTGLFNDRLIEVTSGLKEGDRVLLAPISDEEPLGPEDTQSSTNASESATSHAGQPTNAPPRGAESSSIERGPARSDGSPVSPSGPASGFQRREGPSAEDAVPSEGARGRRGRRQTDPEMQRRMEELMKLSPEEREERMKEFRGRRGQGPGRSENDAGARTPPDSTKP
ncbi:MAG: efflux RND transporter periplasmic adaptor subunit [Verrucomicrobia bacterium]|nr:efflux RND transporter periplasmic adaptor subunit [Verrucomicrobiota bacterium]